MLRKRKNVADSYCPSRRHFFGIAAAAARKLSIISAGASVLSILDSREAAARGRHHHHHGRRHYHPGGRYGEARCFSRGTLILTAGGQISVEDLTIGTQVMTMNGLKPVKWIGHQTIKRNASAVWHPSVLPVRVSRFAIDDQTPRRDVCLSQEHMLFIRGVLIPVKNLVNRRSITFDDAVNASETIEYFHVELETHEVIYAEGMPVETFMYSGGTIAWDNLGDYRKLYGEHKKMSPFAPIHSYDGGFAELRGLIRLAVSRFLDVRDPIQVTYDRLAERALTRVA